jgi:hypothetical protein
MKRYALAAAAVATITLGGCAVYGPDYRPYAYNDYGYRYYEPGVVVYPSVTFGGVYYRDRGWNRHRHWHGR